VSTTAVLTTAFLLRAHAYGESDRIVTFITEDAGKLTGIAKGAKRSQRRFAGTLEPFVKVRVAYRSRVRSDLAFIERCELVCALAGFGTDLDRFACGSYILELTDRLVFGREAGREVFRLLDTALGMLDTLGPRATILRAFELHLLEATGYRPELAACRVCGASPGSRTPAVILVPARGGVCCLACRPPVDPAYELSAASLATLVELQSQPLDAATRAAEDAAITANGALEGLIDHVVTRPLKSRAVLGSLRRSPPAGPA
jgi:DNA repair protein RecO (recombination protein O)